VKSVSVSLLRSSLESEELKRVKELVDEIEETRLFFRKGRYFYMRISRVAAVLSFKLGRWGALRGCCDCWSFLRMQVSRDWIRNASVSNVPRSVLFDVDWLDNLHNSSPLFTLFSTSSMIDKFLAELDVFYDDGTLALSNLIICISWQSVNAWEC